MPRKRARGGVNNNNGLGVQTRKQLQIAAQKLSDTTMTETKPDLANILTLIMPFDGKKVKNVSFYLKEFDTLTDQVKISEEFKLQILKARFIGEARDKLASDESLNSETDYKQFKTKMTKAFQKKDSFTDSQAKFNSIRQKPSQSITDFINEFEIAAASYLNASGHASDDGAKKLFELIKINKFLEAISPNVSLELRKSENKEFTRLCEKAKTIENAFNLTPLEQVNAVTAKAGTDTNEFCANLLKINSDQSAAISELKMEINNLRSNNKQSSMDRNKLNKFCHICNTDRHDIANCWYNLKNNNRGFRKDFQNNGTQQNYVQNTSALVQGYATGGNKPQGLPFIPNYIPFNNQGYHNYQGYPRDNFNGNNFANQNFIPPNNDDYYAPHNYAQRQQPFRRGNMRGSYGYRHYQGRNNVQDNQSKGDNQKKGNNKNDSRSGNK